VCETYELKKGTLHMCYISVTVVEFT